MKHQLEDALLPAPKRAHTLVGARRSAPLTFESALYDELILAILSYLHWTDLCAAQATNRTLARLAADNELWRATFLRTFGLPRLRGVRGFPSREIHPLPKRARQLPLSDERKDWKWMFRISSNWRTGRCRTEHWNDSPIFTGDKQLPVQAILAGSLTITASGNTIHLRDSTQCSHIMACPSHITAMCIDQSAPTSHTQRLAVFLVSGEIIIFSLDPHHLALSTQQMSSTTGGQSQRITQAVYHHPLLAALSDDVSLSIYDVSSSPVVCTQTLTSFTSYPPASMVLSAPNPSSYKLIMCYSMYVYPHHWTVGATELLIAGKEPPPLTRASALSTEDGQPFTTTSTRTMRSITLPFGFIDKHSLAAFKEQWGRKVIGVAATQTDGKWVVLAPQDPGDPGSSSVASSMYSPTTLQLYRLSLSSVQPKLTFVRNLHGQNGPVSSMALADGRCVCLGANGSICVWDLEAGTGTTVAQPLKNVKESSTSGHALVFDERRVITASSQGMIIRSFDV
ncbi:hypothetical protein CYLTODRAFT_422789 [Cylindrobasidium torrendii FP15055 ss-10]|uniref:F-box domain-containing protein n=1 Tax=Cylindrobasidium torrendii FP15055 ss-10 TaxID=1314674 RepID=A0A0D7BCC5_9AGAR|nr:hypothetical protein CYLTODRAFT_422789 [Cylindrobasidium torrendii FP15055 ss-10]